MYVKCEFIDNTSNTVAEAKEILEARKHFKEENFDRVIIQTNAMLIFKILQEKWEVPWIIADMI